MTPREITLAQLQHRETYPVPYTLDFEDDVALRLDAHYGDRQWRDRLQPYIRITGVVDPMKKLPMEKPGYQRDLFGAVWRVDRQPFHLEQPALTEASLDGFDWPAPELFFSDAEKVAAAQELCSQSRNHSFLCAGLGWGLFETSWGLRGFENALMDSVIETDFYETLLDKITDQCRD